MEDNILRMIPGPTYISKEVLNAGNHSFGSADIESEFLNLYIECENHLKEILKTKNDIAIMSGEGMVGLWGAMKSCLKPGDKVLSIATGLFGFGFEDMAKSIGCKTKHIAYNYNESVKDFDKIEEVIKEFRPKMITIVQNETPSGTMNSIEEIGSLKEKYNIPLLLVDAVSGIAGSKVETDNWNIDLCLGASQKCLSAPANLAFVSISKKAWECAEEINYIGYDAILPFKNAVKDFYFPYTMNWQGIAQLNQACKLILREGLENCISRHNEVAKYCRNKIKEIGLDLFYSNDSLPSSTVTAINVPEHIDWNILNKQLKEKGLILGGNYGPLAQKVFRIGHMGSQAHKDNIDRTIEILKDVIHC